MSTNLISFGDSETTVRYREPFLTQGLNRKLAVATPPGVYRGFKINTDPGAGDRTVLLTADATNSDHVAVYQTETGYSLTVRKMGGDILLDLSGCAATWHVITIYATYAVGSTTSAVLRAYTLAEYASAAEKNELVVLGCVQVPASGIIASNRINDNYRTMAWKNKASESVSWSPVLRNSGFEWGQTGTTLATGRYYAAFWEKTEATINGQWYLQTTDPHSGKKHLELTFATASVSADVEQHVGVPVVEGQRVRIRVYKKMVQAATGGSLYLYLYFTDSSGTELTALSYTFTTSSIDTSYEEIDQIFRAPTNAAHLKRVVLSASALTAGSSGSFIRIDDFQGWVEVSSETAGLEVQTKGLEHLTGLTLRDPEGVFNDLEALLTFDKDSPAGEGTVSLGRRDRQAFSAAVQPPALSHYGRILNLGSGLISSAAQARVPRIQGLQVPWTIAYYTLLAEFPVTVMPEYSVRIYLAPNDDTEAGGLIITTNAAWSSGTSTWTRDVSGTTSRAWGFTTVSGMSMAQDSSGGSTFFGWDWTGAQSPRLSFDGELLVPATSYLGSNLLSTAGQARSARIYMEPTDPAVSRKVLLMEFPDYTYGCNVRVYRDDNAAWFNSIQVTINARWTGTLWSKDTSGVTATCTRFTLVGITQERRITDTGWADDAWEQTVWIYVAGNNSYLRFPDGYYRISESTSHTNPAYNLPPYANTLYAKNIIKAWGYINCNTTTPGIEQGFNISSASFPANYDLQVNFGTAMADSKYIVLFGNSMASTGDDKFPYMHTPATGSFRMSMFDNSTPGRVADIRSTGFLFHFAVLGQQDS